MILVGLMMVPVVVAFGVGSLYTSDNPLYLNPGEVKDTFLILQNPSNEKVVATGYITGGSEIVSFLDESQKYTIEPGREMKANIRIQVPEDSQGNEYKVMILFKPAVEKTDDTVQFVANIGRIFPVIVAGEKPEEEESLESQVVLREFPIEPQEPSQALVRTTLIITLSVAIIIVTILGIVLVIRLSRKSSLVLSPDAGKIKQEYKKQTRNS
jgi:hypothetical protein